MTNEESIKSLFAALKDLWLINKLMIRFRLALAWLGLFYRSERGKQVKNKLRLELKTGKAIPLKFYLAYLKTNFPTSLDHTMASLPEDCTTDFNRDGLDASHYDPLNHSTSKQRKTTMLTPNPNIFFTSTGTGTCTRPSDSSSVSTKSSFGLPSLAPVLTNPLYGIFAALGTVFFFTAFRKSLTGITQVFRRVATPPLAATRLSADRSADQDLSSELAKLKKTYQKYKNFEEKNISEGLKTDKRVEYKKQLTIVLSSLETDITSVTKIDIHSEARNICSRIDQLSQRLTILNAYITELNISSNEYDYTDLISRFEDFMSNLDSGLAEKFNLWSPKVISSVEKNAHELLDLIALNDIDDSAIVPTISTIFDSTTPFDSPVEDIESLLTLIMRSNTDRLFNNACQSFKNAINESLREVKKAAKDLPLTHTEYHHFIGQLKEFSSRVDELSTAPEDIFASRNQLYQFDIRIRQLAEDQRWRPCAKKQFNDEKQHLLVKIENTTKALLLASPSADTTADTAHNQSPAGRRRIHKDSVFQTPTGAQGESSSSSDRPISPVREASTSAPRSSEENDPTPATEFQPGQSDINYLNSARLDRHNKSQNPLLNAFRDDGASDTEASETETGSLAGSVDFF